MKITMLESFPPNQNPFCHDSYHMGVHLGSNLVAMLDNHSDKECKYVILVNVKTGERMRVNVVGDETSGAAKMIAGCQVE